MIWLKEKYAKKNKKQKESKCFTLIVSVYSRGCGSYKRYLEDDSPHQTVMIMCELKCILGDVGVIRGTSKMIVPIKQL